MMDKTIEYCIWAMIERFPDGSILCPLMESSDWTCADCMEVLERMDEEGYTW